MPPSQCEIIPHSSPVTLQCSMSHWKKICRLIPSEKRASDCSHTTSDSSQQGFFLEFQASQISLYSTPLSSTLGAADIYVDGIWSGQLKLIPNNTPWSKIDLNASTIHTLTIFPSTGSAPTFLPMDLFVLTLSNQTTSPDFLPTPELDIELNLYVGLASQKDGSSGIIISIASLAAVAVVVFICSACYFFSRSRRQPGFHMPSVLVNVTSSDYSNMEFDVDNCNGNNRIRNGYERYELSTMFSTVTTNSTWKDSDEIDQPPEPELKYSYPPLPEVLPPSHPSMIVSPNNTYASSSSQNQTSGSETPKRRLSWHGDSIQESHS